MKLITDFFFNGNLFWKIVLWLWSIFTSLFTYSQENQHSELFQTLKAKDSVLFERTFNRCELKKLDDLIDTDFEFYHDVSGIQNQKEFIQAIQQNICASKNQKPIRKLVNESLTVYPLKNNGKIYGAIQKGKHLFFLKENTTLTPTGSALFTHLWLLKNNSWKLHRVLSYQHLPVQH